MEEKEIHLSVIVPAYNEERRLPKTLRAIYDYLKKQNYTSEIIVVSDGSRDRTAEVTRNLMPEMPILKLIDNKENHGKGYVVRQGLLESKGRCRLFTDADNSTSIEHVEKFWPEFEKGFEIIIGSRDIKGAVIPVPQPWWRRKLGDIFNLIVQFLTGLWGIWDTQCGFKGFTAKACQEILPKCKIDRWAFDPEILVVARKLRYKIKEVPVTWINEAESKVKFKGMVKMLFELLQVRRNMMTGVYKK